MSHPVPATLQGHFTLRFTTKSPADTVAAKGKIAALIPELYRGADATGIIHYGRFIELDGIIFLLADYDGDLSHVLGAMAQHLGPVLDPLLALVSGAPPTPVAEHPAAFVKWAQSQCIPELLGFVSCPGATVQHIKSLAAAAGIAPEPYAGQQLALLPIMPMKGPVAVTILEAAFKVLYGALEKGANGVGTVHFVHLAEFPGQKVGFFTAYDGPWDKYLQDFATQMGPAFDLLFRFTKTSPAFPTSKHAEDFSAWVQAHELKPLAFYAAYPGLQVQDIRTLLAGH